MEMASARLLCCKITTSTFEVNKYVEEMYLEIPHQTSSLFIYWFIWTQFLRLSVSCWAPPCMNTLFTPPWFSMQCCPLSVDISLSPFGLQHPTVGHHDLPPPPPPPGMDIVLFCPILGMNRSERKEKGRKEDRGRRGRSSLSLLCLVAQSCPILCDCDIMDGSLPGSSVHGIFFRQNYWNGLPFSLSGDFPDPGIKPAVDSLPSEASKKPIVIINIIVLRSVFVISELFAGLSSSLYSSALDISQGSSLEDNRGMTQSFNYVICITVFWFWDPGRVLILLIHLSLSLKKMKIIMIPGCGPIFPILGRHFQMNGLTAAQIQNVKMSSFSPYKTYSSSWSPYFCEYTHSCYEHLLRAYC